jgi:hypothetical protein
MSLLTDRAFAIEVTLDVLIHVVIMGEYITKPCGIFI